MRSGRQSLGRLGSARLQASVMTKMCEVCDQVAGCLEKGEVKLYHVSPRERESGLWHVWNAGGRAGGFV